MANHLTFTAYSDKTYQSKVAGEEYEVMLNPEKLTWDNNLDYNYASEYGSAGEEPKYNKSIKKLSFDLVIDCTGIVDSKRTDMVEEISKLKKIIYDFNGKIHRPNFIVIRWGKDVNFKGILNTFNVNYTLFKPNGTPLRAKVSLGFRSSIDAAIDAKEKGKESPDMTHLVDVSLGDSLPQLSQKIYDETDYYVEVAEFNGLNKFRNLKPNTQLTFPPIVNGVT